MITQDGDICCSPVGESLFFVARENYVIQQWTGLLDVKGRDIYEGDIVSWKHPMEDFGEVLFVTVDLGPDVGFFGVKTKRLGVCHFQSDDEYEVVGNIYENPLVD